MVTKGRYRSGPGICAQARDVKYYETIFDILAKQFEIAKLDEAREERWFRLSIPRFLRIASPSKRVSLRSSPRLRDFSSACGGVLPGGLDPFERGS